MKTCFVIMGFGKKRDYRTGIEVNLDIVYNDVIQPLIDKSFPEYKVIRGDEIPASGSIDVPMYKLLLDADLVIADITTHNDNALYELGIRYALRQASTIVIAQHEEESKDMIPFDLSHLRMIFYDKLTGPNEEEHKEMLSKKLRRAIDASQDGHVDSPIYTYLNDLQPPIKNDNLNITRDEIEKIQQIAETASLGQKAMSDSDFDQAISDWKKLNRILPNNTYFIQQWALATYKSKKPEERSALEKAWEIINRLPIKDTMDTETLGIAGAICKNLSQLKDNSPEDAEKYLNQAQKLYRKSYNIDHDYYTGENYANCILLKLKDEKLCKDDRVGLNYLRRQVCKEIVEQLSNKATEGPVDKWEAATLSNCYLHLGDRTNADKYEKVFLDKGPSQWEKETFENTKKLIMQIVLNEE